jgi:hypothetical protein
MSSGLGEFSLDRMVRAVEKVRERLLRAARALEASGVSYAVAGGNAVAAWVSRVDESAARNTRDVDLLVRREDFHAVRDALEGAGFLHRHSAGIELFLDGPGAKARDALRVVFAREFVRPAEPIPNPDVSDSEDAGSFRVLSLPALVQIKLTAYRDKDRTHLRDLIDVGLIDASWCERFPDVLAARLRHLLETPGG